MGHFLTRPMQHPSRIVPIAWQLLPLLAVWCGTYSRPLNAQTQNENSLQDQVQQLSEAMARTQAQMEASQRQLDEMRRQLTALQHLMAKGESSASTSILSNPAASSSSSDAQAAAMQHEIDAMREEQDLQESQIATQAQAKVESGSKYPVKISGLLLLNGFVNTREVVPAPTPTIALPGAGSTGASVEQSVLGLDARGPHIFGAGSYADVRVDFDGSTQPGSSDTSSTAYAYSNVGLLRLRTAHAGLQWNNSELSFSLDRPIFSTDAPASLTAVAVPALAWSGNLWTWNPQVGASHDLGFLGTSHLRLQSALIDVGDAPLSTAAASAAVAGTTATAAEQSRWPGEEAHIALLGSKLDEGNHLGVGGYFAPHLTPVGDRFDAWAATLDTRVMLPARLQFTGSFYRGLALGGLGGGGYKDYAVAANKSSGGYYFRPLDDVGGWAQLQEKLSERVELNAAFGLDNVFARELFPYRVAGGTLLQNLARNRTYTANVIYSPRTYILFSLEYRYLASAPVTGDSAGSNVIGLGAGYKF